MKITGTQNKRKNQYSFLLQEKYSGSVVKTKIWDFYNELIWLISYREHRESSWTFPSPIYAKLHMATALPDSSIQPVSYNQVQNDAAQSCKCGYTVRWQFWLLWCYCIVSDKLLHIWSCGTNAQSWCYPVSYTHRDVYKRQSQSCRM